MTIYKNLLVLLNDIETFMDTQQSPEAERLIGRARAAIAKDFGGEIRVRNDEGRPSAVEMSR